jgi:hypothetical protein
MVYTHQLRIQDLECRLQTPDQLIPQLQRLIAFVFFAHGLGLNGVPSFGTFNLSSYLAPLPELVIRYKHLYG